MKTANSKTRKTRKTRKPEMTPAEILEAWCAGETDTAAAREEARATWEAGQAGHFDLIDEFGQVFHVEKFHLEAGGYIVVVWDDNGDVTFGGI